MVTAADGGTEPRTPGRNLVIGLIVSVLTVWVAGGVFLAAQYLTSPHFTGVDPAGGTALDSSELDLRFSVPNFRPDRDTLLVTLDGEPVPEDSVTAEEGAAQLSVTVPDGRHSLRAEVDSPNLIPRGRSLRTWFVVDTVEPEIDLAEGQTSGVSEKGAGIRFTTSEPVEAVFSMNGTEVPLRVEGDLLIAEPILKEGSYEATLSVADPAGNEASRTWTMWADYSVPELVVEGPARWDEAAPVFALRVRDTTLGGIRVAGTVDGGALAVAEVTEAEALYEGLADEPEVQFVTNGDAAGEVPAGRSERLFRVGGDELAEGRHEIQLSVTDRGGNRAEASVEVLVDSTSQFGSRPMVAGAEGDDVRELQELLAAKAGYAGAQTGVLDEATMASLVTYKKDEGLGDEPILDETTLHSLLGRITIDLSERRLYLYDGTTLVKQFPVAVGQPRYPTPTGDYNIRNKARNPTWTPPPSPWADGLEPVPPGPNNPLGTRWMGLTAPHVGIHGTYASSSIGTAASHGCIRMHIRDVEELFELVYVGTPVSIVP